MNSSFAKVFNKYLPSSQHKKKFKRQCLKAKNILQENESIQIGCKIQKLYDFYTSKNFVQVNIFIGNKLNRPIDRYSIDFKGSNNLSIFIQDKQQKYIKENTQGKQRLVIEWVPDTQSSSGEVLLVMSFSSAVFSLKDTVIPLTLWSFYNFPENLQKLIPLNTTPQLLFKKFKQKYQLIEEQSFELNINLFKKGFNIKDTQKFLSKLLKLQQRKTSKSQPNKSEQKTVFTGVFTVKNLLQQVAIIVQLNHKDQSPRLKVTIAGNQYTYFEQVFENIKFLFG